MYLFRHVFATRSVHYICLNSELMNEVYKLNFFGFWKGVLRQTGRP